MPLQTVLIASDHAGFEFKTKLMRSLPDINWIDLGPSDASRVDYPDYADRVAKRISSLRDSLDPGTKDAVGVLICGSGQGMAMRANRFSRVRAALAWNPESVILSREHNDANILCLGARLIDPELGKSLVKLFLATKFQGGRHSERVKKIERPAQ